MFLSFPLSLSTSVCLLLYLSIYLSVQTFVSLSLSLSLCLHLKVHIHLSMEPLISLSLSLSLSLCIYIYKRLYLSIYFFKIFHICEERVLEAQMLQTRRERVRTPFRLYHSLSGKYPWENLFSTPPPSRGLIVSQKLIYYLTKKLNQQTISVWWEWNFVRAAFNRLFVNRSTWLNLMKKDIEYLNYEIQRNSAQSAGAVEYTNCFSVEM